MQMCTFGLTSMRLSTDFHNTIHFICSKPEFVIYKLKEMGKVSEKEIAEVCRKFDRIDTGNCGKITLADLMESHH